MTDAERAVREAMPEKREPRKQPVAPWYAFLHARLAEVAKAHGYAVGLHGTMNRDLDLIACPWTDEAVSAEELVAAFAKECGIEGTNIDPTERGRPFGRRCWSLRLAGDMYVDLSVMARQDDALLGEVERLREELAARTSAMTLAHATLGTTVKQRDAAEALVREAIDIIEGRPGEESPFAWPDKARAALARRTA